MTTISSSSVEVRKNAGETFCETATDLSLSLKVPAGQLLRHDYPKLASGKFFCLKPADKKMK